MAALVFLEAPIDDAVARGMERTKAVPGRTMRYGPTGKLSQNYTASFPIHRYDLAPGVRYAAQFHAIEALWYVVHFGTGGPYAGFLLKDWADFRLTQTNSRLTLIADNDAIAPPPSSTILEQKVSSTDKTTLRFPVGHIGLSTSSKGPKQIWPKVAAWLAEHSEPAT